MTPRPTIFISAVTKELKSARQLVANTLQFLGYEPVWQDVFGTEQGDLREVLRKQIDKCGGLVQLVGQCYGAEPPEPDSQFGRVSYSHYEALYARERGKKVWYLVLEECFPADPHSLEPAELVNLQAEYRERIQKDAELFHPVGTLEGLRARVYELRSDLSKLRLRFTLWAGGVVSLLVLIAGLVSWVLIAVSAPPPVDVVLHEPLKTPPQIAALREGVYSALGEYFVHQLRFSVGVGTGRDAERAGSAFVAAMKDLEDARGDPEEVGRLDNVESCLARALSEDDPRIRSKAAEVVGLLGPAAVDLVAPLEERLDDEDLSVRVNTAEALWLIRGQAPVSILIEGLQSPDLRRSAVRTLGEMGPSAKEAASHLIQALTDPDGEYRGYVAKALWEIDRGESVRVVRTVLDLARDRESFLVGSFLEQIGPEAKPAIPLLVNALTEDNEAANLAAKALGSMGSEGLEAVPALLQTLAVSRLSHDVEDALDEIDPPLEVVLPAITEALPCSDWAFKSWTGKVLDSVNSTDQALAPQLVKLVERLDRDGEVADHALKALGRFGRAAKPSFISLLRHEVGLIRVGAAEALADIEPQSPEVLRVLSEAMTHADESVRVRSLAVLANLNADVQVQLPWLLQALNHNKEFAQPWAVVVLRQVGPKDGASAAKVFALLDHTDKTVADPMITAVFDALRAMGAEAAPTLIGALQDASLVVRARAAQTLGQIRPAVKAAAEPLADLLARPQDEAQTKVNEAVFNALRAIGPDAMPALLGTLQHGDPLVRTHAAQTLGAIGSPAESAVESLKNLVSKTDEDSRVRISAAEALWRIDRQVDPGVTVLSELLAHKHPLVRKSAAQALGAIGPPAKASRGRLEELLEEDDPSVRAAAEAALIEIGL